MKNNSKFSFGHYNSKILNNKTRLGKIIKVTLDIKTKEVVDIYKIDKDP